MAVFTHPKYQEVVVHDLRTPLNVISLALRMLDALAASQAPDLAEDLALIRANAAEQERMLTYLVDFSRLPDGPEGLAPSPFDPARMIDEVLIEHRARAGAPPVEFDAADAPRGVTLDYNRARMAIQRVLANASAASGGAPIRVRLGGGDSGRCVVTVSVAVPPRDSVFSHDIDPLMFERLLGTPAERRGLDLTTAARISSLFGGAARLEVAPGQGTAVILDWPTALQRPE